MRIIAGSKKGRKLASPKGDLIRPTSDKVKGGIFNSLAASIPDSVVVDLFAGSGALGIEALSRDAEKCYFVDFARDSIALVKKNLQHVDLEEKSEVISDDYTVALKEISEKVDIIFADPPYDKSIYQEVLEKVGESDILKANGIVVLERDTFASVPDEQGKLKRYKTKKYGKTSVDFYELT